MLPLKDVSELFQMYRKDSSNTSPNFEVNAMNMLTQSGVRQTGLFL